MSQTSLGGAGDLRPDEKEILAAKKRKLQRRYRRWTACIVAVLVISLAVLLGRWSDGILNDPTQDTSSLESSGAEATAPEPGKTEAPKPTSPIQLDWAAWQDALPDFVNAGEYDIEERMIYSARVLETTSSTTQTAMEGWECYDTVQGDGAFGAWSEWSPNAIDSSDTREVGTQIRYRYRDKKFNKSSSSSMSGWELYDTTYQWGSYGGWSGWMTNSISESDSRQVESKMQYRYRDISYSTEYTPWGGWGDWQWNRENTSDLKKEESREVYRWYCYICSYCGAHMPYTTASYGECFTQLGGCGRSGANYKTSGCYEYCLTTSPSEGTWAVYNKRYVVVDGAKWYISSGDTSVTQYRYTTRSTKQVASYGNWSSWSDASYSSSSFREVQTRTVYRYRDRQRIPTYHFWKWGGWSAWSEPAVSGNSDRQVETATYYRYRDKVFTPTYYFHRWGDWSEYTADVVEPSDTVEVQTKTQYRYKSK